MSAELPGENEFVAQLTIKLSQEFNFCDRILGCFVDESRFQRICNRVTEWARSDAVSLVLISTFIKICRVSRSVLHLTRIGQAESAHVLARSQFEACVQLLFVLMPKVRIEVRKDRNGKASARSPNPLNNRLKSHRLDRELRAKLVLAHSAIENQRNSRRLQNEQYPYRLVRSFQSSNDGTLLQDIEREIGSDWCTILRTTGSYSGLSFKELLPVIHRKLSIWHRTIYHLQSRNVHGGDIQHYFDLNSATSVARPRWLSAENQIRAVLSLSIGLFRAMIAEIDAQIDLGPANHMILDSLGSEYKGIFLAPDP